MEDTIGIDNAPWWLPHSNVVVREDYTAADEAWVTSRMARVSIQGGSGSKAGADVQMGSKEKGVLQVERMVMPGSVVAVARSKGRVKTVQLPQEAEKLLLTDLNYIIQAIDALNDVMMPEEHDNFLPGAGEQSETSLKMVK